MTEIVPALEKSIEFSQGISSDNTKRTMHLEKENLDLKNSIQILEKQCMDQKNSMLNLEKNLNVKILNLERYSREFNIRFVGIPEKDNENCHNIIAKKIREENLYPGDENEILGLIENAHRTGSKSPTGGQDKKKTTRQIIDKFFSRPVKNSIMKAARASVNRNRNTSFMAYEDLPREDYQLKKKAQKQMDQAYKQGKKVRFWRGNMWINGKIEEIK